MAGFSQLAAEALQHSEGEQDLEKKIDQALSCPCLGDLKEGPCGPTFVHAFTCFMRSDHEDKGMDCLDQFKDFQVCLQKNPEHLAKIMEGDEEREKTEEAEAAQGQQGGVQ